MNELIDVEEHEDFAIIVASERRVAILDVRGWLLKLNEVGFRRGGFSNSTVSDYLRGAGAKGTEAIVSRVSASFAARHNLRGGPYHWARRGLNDV